MPDSPPLPRFRLELFDPTGQTKKNEWTDLTARITSDGFAADVSPAGDCGEMTITLDGSQIEAKDRDWLALHITPQGGSSIPLYSGLVVTSAVNNPENPSTVKAVGGRKKLEELDSRLALIPERDASDSFTDMLENETSRLPRRMATINNRTIGGNVATIDTFSGVTVGRIRPRYAKLASIAATIAKAAGYTFGVNGAGFIFWQRKGSRVLEATNLDADVPGKYGSEVLREVDLELTPTSSEEVWTAARLVLAEAPALQFENTRFSFNAGTVSASDLTAFASSGLESKYGHSTNVRALTDLGILRLPVGQFAVVYRTDHSAPENPHLATDDDPNTYALVRTGPGSIYPGFAEITITANTSVPLFAVSYRVSLASGVKMYAKLYIHYAGGEGSQDVYVHTGAGEIEDNEGTLVLLGDTAIRKLYTEARLDGRGEVIKQTWEIRFISEANGAEVKVYDLRPLALRANILQNILRALWKTPPPASGAVVFPYYVPPAEILRYHHHSDPGWFDGPKKTTDYPVAAVRYRYNAAGFYTEFEIGTTNDPEEEGLRALVSEGLNGATMDAIKFGGGG